MKHPLMNKYYAQLKNAERRQIEFLLTFEEWLIIWENSGHLHERGRGRYVMARLGDTGPYAVGNVKIITLKENAQEAFLNKSPEELECWKEGMRRGGRQNAGRSRPDLSERNRLRRGQPRRRESIEKMRQTNIGSKRSPETRAKMSASMKAARARKYWSSRSKTPC